LIVLQSSSSASLQAQSAFAGVAGAGGNAGDMRGGPNGIVKTVLRGTELPVDGLMVQLISHKTSIRTTVYTNELGQFEFPKLVLSLPPRTTRRSARRSRKLRRPRAASLWRARHTCRAPNSYSSSTARRATTFSASFFPTE
jgi:hypothetical protein